MIGTIKITKSDFKVGSFKYETTRCKAPNQVQLRTNDADIGAIVGEGDNTYIIQNNFLLYGKTTEELTQIGQRWLHNINYDIFNPYSVVTRGKPWIELGDKITVVGDRDTVSSMILERTLKGIQALTDTYEAKGEERFSEANGIHAEMEQLRGLTNELIKTNAVTESKLTAIENVWDESEIPTDKKVEYACIGDPNTNLPASYNPTPDSLCIDQETGKVYIWNNAGKWVYYMQLGKVKGNLSTTIRQTASSVSITAKEDAQGKSCGIHIQLKDYNGNDLDSGSADADITLTGLVAFEDLATEGRTVINGGNIQTEKLSTLSANIGEIDAGTISFVGAEQIYRPFSLDPNYLYQEVEIELPDGTTQTMYKYGVDAIALCCVIKQPVEVLIKAETGEEYYPTYQQLEKSECIQVGQRYIDNGIYIDNEGFIDPEYGSFVNVYSIDKCPYFVIRKHKWTGQGSSSYITRDNEDIYYISFGTDAYKNGSWEYVYGPEGNYRPGLSIDYAGRLIATEAELAGNITGSVITGSTFRIGDELSPSLEIQESGYLISAAGAEFEGTVTAENFHLGRSKHKYTHRGPEGQVISDYEYKFRVDSEGYVETYGNHYGMNVSHPQKLHYQCLSERGLAVWGVGWEDINGGYRATKLVPMQMLFINGLYCGIGDPGQCGQGMIKAGILARDITSLPGFNLPNEWSGKGTTSPEELLVEYPNYIVSALEEDNI